MELSDASPLLGVGFDTFWLGPRLETIWSRYWWLPRAAHNGYVETYLSLGLIGVVLLVWLIVAAVPSRSEASQEDRALLILRLTFVLTTITYNITETAFKGPHLIWFTFMLFGCRGLLRAPDEATVPARAPSPAAGPALGWQKRAPLPR